MNLAALANVITIRCGQVQPKDLAACKSFLTFRHDQLYRSKLWKDSLIEWLQGIDPNAAPAATSNYMPTKGNVILPSIFEHVIASRTSEHKLDVDRPMLYYRVDQDQFAKIGIPLNYLLLSKAVWEFDTPAAGAQLPYLSFWNNNVADAGTVLTLDVAAADLVSINRVNTAPGVFFAQTDRIENLLKVATQGSVDLVAGPNGLVVTNNSGNNAFFTANYPGGVQVPFALGPGVAQTISGVNLVSISDGTVTFGMPPNSQRGGTVSYTAPHSFLVAISPTILTLQATDTQAPKRQRIRLMDLPNAATTLRVLGKRTVPPFSADGDIPGVDGMDSVLMPMAYYDMLHRDEQGGTKAAADALEEASGLLRQLEAEEVVQGASNSRIMPESGLGPDEYYVGPIF